MKTLLSLATVILLLSLGAGTVSASIVYDNTNGFSDNFNVGSWGIADSFAIADSFTGVGNVQGVNFWVWALPGDSLSSVQWSIVTNSGGLPTGTTVAGGVVSSLASTLVETNLFGFSIFEESFSTGTVSLSPGDTYWLELQNAVVPDGDYIYWDQSDGPSIAWSNVVGLLSTPSSGCGGAHLPGTTCSETFQLIGTTSATPEPGTLVLLATGLLGLGPLIRRRLG